MKKHIPNEIIEMVFYKTTAEFIEALKKHGQEIPRSKPDEFIRHYDAESYIGCPFYTVVFYFKDSNEYIALDELIEEEYAFYDFENVTPDSMIVFGYSAGPNITEEISNIGLKEFFEELPLTWEKYYEMQRSPEAMKTKWGEWIIERANQFSSLDRVCFFTAWEGWSYRDPQTGEGDYGFNYLGIVDMRSIDYIKVEE